MLERHDRDNEDDEQRFHDDLRSSRLSATR